MADVDDPIEELLPFYALGAVSDEEREQVEAYLVAHPAARARLAEMQQTAGALPFALTPVEPPKQLKASLMSRIESDARVRFPAQTPQSKQATSKGLWARLFQTRASLAFAGLCLVVAVGALAWALTLNGDMTRLRDDIAALQGQLQEQGELLAKIAVPGVQTLPIRGTAGQHGNLLTSPESKSAIVLLAGLSQISPDEVYQFWLIRDSVMISAGTFTVDEKGGAILVITSNEDIGLFDHVGVSREPQGGSPQPTNVIFVSEL